AGVHGELDVDLGAIVEVAQHQLGVQHFDVARDLDVTGNHGARALFVECEAFRPLGIHLDGDFLDVQHEVRNVFAHARQGREFVQDTVNLDGGDGCALQRGQQ